MANMGCACDCGGCSGCQNNFQFQTLANNTQAGRSQFRASPLARKPSLETGWTTNLYDDGDLVLIEEDSKS